jgi:hypothetical protein
MYKITIDFLTQITLALRNGNPHERNEMARRIEDTYFSEMADESIKDLPVSASYAASEGISHYTQNT